MRQERSAPRVLPLLVGVLAALLFALFPASAQERGELVVSDPTVVPGQAIRVEGQCPPETAGPVQVVLDGPETRLLASTGAQAGAFAATVRIPEDVTTGVRALLLGQCPGTDRTLQAPVAVIEGGLQPMGAPEPLPVEPRAQAEQAGDDALASVPSGGVAAGAGGTADGAYTAEVLGHRTGRLVLVASALVAFATAVVTLRRQSRLR